MLQENYTQNSEVKFDGESRCAETVPKPDHVPRPPFGSRNPTMCNRHVDESQSVDLTSNSQTNFGIEVELDNLKELILNSSHIPLTELTIIDEELILEQLQQIQERLPIELATAIEIVNRRQEIIADAHSYAGLIVKSAEEKALQITQESAIVRQAELDGAKIRLQTEQECDRLRQKAIAECEAIQQDADRYADCVLETLESRLQEMLTIVQNGRQQLEP